MSYINQADNLLQVDNFTADSHIIQSLFATKMCFCSYTYHFLFPIKRTKTPSSNKGLTHSQFVCPQSRNHPGVAEEQDIYS